MDDAEGSGVPSCQGADAARDGGGNVAAFAAVSVTIAAAVRMERRAFLDQGIFSFDDPEADSDVEQAVRQEN